MSSHQSPIRALSGEEEALVKGIGDSFAIGGEVLSVGALDTGLINSTYVITVSNGEAGPIRFLLQRINETVFADPVAVMRNVELVTSHINAKVLRKRSDLGGQTLSLFPSRDGRLYLEGPSGGIWRCYNFLEGCQTHDVVENERQAFEAGRAFGAFQDLVSDLSPDRLVETIPDFHNTRKRLETLVAAAREDPAGRVHKVGAELDFIEARQDWVDRLELLHQAGEAPRRITHNDTKINNVMFDTATDTAVCVIDLDTVMPGLSLYDFGDLVRTATNPAGEDERDLSRVAVREDIFEALVRGYLETAGGMLTEAEISHLPFSGRLLSLELGMRFLTDYLEGDRYFKVGREGQNLDRARCQLHLVGCLEKKEADMQGIVASVVAESG